MLAFLLWLLVSLSSAHAGWVAPAAPRTPHPAMAQASVRFHHVHFRVGDPSAAMSYVTARVDGTRVIVPGVGVGVRAGDEFLIFDRLDETDPPELTQPPIAEAYRAAAAWLRKHGVASEPAEVTSVRLAAAFSEERYDHVAFAAGDLGEVTRVLSGAGGTVIHRTEDAVLFDAGGGLRVELVRETGRPDAFWCPMHPDVRSADAGACHVCGMDLVPIPPPKLGEYNLDVTQVRSRGGSGLAGLELAVRDPESNDIVKRFVTIHERPFHLFIVGRDLEYFEHVHPKETADGSFVLAHAVPPGEYMLIADFLPVGGTTQTVQRALIVGGTRRSPTPGAASSELRITLEPRDFAAGKYACLTLTVRDARTGQPVTDLEPYLGAPAHMLIVRSDLTDAVHAHPEEQATGGPVITFHPLVPAAGDYKLWVQVQRAGKVITVPFSLRAER